MCDYSLESYKSRAAVDGEELVVKQFPSGSRGLVESGREELILACAVCCKPGVEMILHLDGSYNVRESATQYANRGNVLLHGEIPVTFHTLAREDLPKTAWGMTPHQGYRDGFVIPDGHFLSIQDLKPGTRAIVTKALPKELTEAARGEKAFEPEIRIEEPTAPAPIEA